MIIGFDMTPLALFGVYIAGYATALVVFITADHLARRYFGKDKPNA